MVFIITGWWWLEIYEIGRLLDHQAKLGFIRVSDPNMTLKVSG